MIVPTISKDQYTPDWGSIEPKYKFVTVDADRSVTKHKTMPVLVEEDGFWYSETGVYFTTTPHSPEDFREMIYERPIKI